MVPRVSFPFSQKELYLPIFLPLLFNNILKVSSQLRGLFCFCSESFNMFPEALHARHTQTVLNCAKASLGVPE